MWLNFLGHSPGKYEEGVSQYRFSQYNTIYEDQDCDENKPKFGAKRIINSPLQQIDFMHGKSVYESAELASKLDQLHNENNTFVKKLAEHPNSDGTGWFLIINTL